MAKNITIKLAKSLNGRLEKQVATAHSLGLRKIGDVTVQPDNDSTRGKIAKIGYLHAVCPSAASTTFSQPRWRSST